MPDLQVLTTLDSKRRDIEAYIRKLERDIEQARSDLSAVLAAMRVFSAEGTRVTAYMNLTRLFPRNELPKLAREALAGQPDGINTREIAAYILRAKGLDAGDRHLRKTIANKTVHLLRQWERRGQAKRLGKIGTALVWKLPVAIT